MTNKLFHALSPIWQALFSILGVGMIANLMVMLDWGDGSPLDSSSFAASLNLLLVFAFFITTFFAQRKIDQYNKAHPKKPKLTLFAMHPPELLDDDERTSVASSMATRNVYVYNNYTFPLLFIGLLLLRESLGLFLALMFIYLIGYYGTYLRAIWPYLDEN